MKAILLKRFLFLAIFCLTTIGIHAQSTACNETQGIITRQSYFSTRLGQNMFYRAYTPPCYDVASSYPVLYLMHGSNEDDGHWLRLGLPEILDNAIQAGEIPPLIVILPFGNVIANRNRFDDVSWANIFLNELMPHAEENYNISTQASYRGIGGISRGGFWAYQIAFSHPDMFSVVGGHSAFFDPFNAPDEYNPLDLALTADGIDSLRLWFDRGVGDFAAPGLEIMNERLTERGLEYIYNVYPDGEHNNAYWSQHVAEYIDFYTASWSQARIKPTLQANMFATNTPTAPENTDSDDSILYLPIVAFPSLQTSLSLPQIQFVADGNYDENLALTPTVFSNLQSLNINFHPDTRIVESDELRNTLWQNREGYSFLPINEITLDYRILLLDDAPILDQLDIYPFAGDDSDSRLTRITLSGVTALARNTRIALNENSIEWAAEAIIPYVQSADFFHMSNEVSFVENCPQFNNNMLGGSNSFCSTREHFELFNLLDVDILELTGNHNNDYGYQAYSDTLTFYNENNIATIGGGRTLADARQPLILSHNGNTIALLACNAAGPYYALVNEDENVLGGIRPGAAACDWNWLENDLPLLSQQVDTLIVTIQYVEIEDYLPSNQQRIDFRRIANLGGKSVV